MVCKKDRKKSGWVTPKAIISKKEMIENDLFLEDFYDDWCDYRDGVRDWFSDFKLIKKIHLDENIFGELVQKRLKMNKKQKKLLIRRKIKKGDMYTKKHFVPTSK